MMASLASAQSRRAVARRPRSHRFSGLVSVALVLPLAASRDWTASFASPSTGRSNCSFRATSSELRVYTRRAQSSAAADAGLPARDEETLRSMEFREPIERLIRDPRSSRRTCIFPDPAQIRIYDETLRDGEQMPGVCFTPHAKIRNRQSRLADIGVHVMSVGFPAASDGDRKTLQLVMEAKRRGELGDVEIVVMCRSNPNDIDVTVETLDEVGVSPVRGDVLHFYERQRSCT